MGFAKNPRKIRNFLIRPQYQLKFIFYLVALITAMMGTFVTIILIRLEALRKLVTNNPSISYTVQSEMTEIIISLMGWTLIAFIVFCLIAFIYGVIISHRIAGPMVAIQHYINDLKAGKLDSNRHLREYDELHPIMDGLHELAEKLKQK